MVIARSNLISALVTAIEAREKYEELLHYTADSALLAGWKAVLESLREGDDLVIRNA